MCKGWNRGGGETKSCVMHPHLSLDGKAVVNGKVECAIGVSLGQLDTRFDSVNQGGHALVQTLVCQSCSNCCIAFCCTATAATAACCLWGEREREVSECDCPTPHGCGYEPTFGDTIASCCRHWYLTGGCVGTSTRHWVLLCWWCGKGAGAHERCVYLRWELP